MYVREVIVKKKGLHHWIENGSKYFAPPRNVHLIGTLPIVSLTPSTK